MPIQDVKVKCSGCGRQSRVASLSGHRTVTLTGSKLVCPGCSRRVAMPRGVYSFDPAGVAPILRPLD